MYNLSYLNSTVAETIFGIGFILEHCLAWGIGIVNTIILLFIISKKRLRTPFNIVIGSMAVCCLLFVFGSLFPSIVVELDINSKNVYNFIFIPLGTSATSILNLQYFLLLKLLRCSSLISSWLNILVSAILKVRRTSTHSN